MRCPNCSSENLPVRETSRSFGSHVSHPRNCGACGAALTVQCPVCTDHHVIGTKFCQADGVEIEAFKREEDLWSALVGPRRASLSVRPAVHRFVFVSVMVLVTGYAAYLTMLLNVDADETLRGNYIALTCFFLFVLGPAAVLASGIVSGWRYYVAYYRRARLFHEQHFKLIKATKERLFV